MGEPCRHGHPENYENDAGECACVPAEQVVVAVTLPSVGLDVETFTSAPVQTLHLARFLRRWRSCWNAYFQMRRHRPRTAITEIETLLQRLLPGVQTRAPRPRPVLARRDWTTMVCFSCGKPGHGVGRCPELDETFPYMLPGWSAEKVGANYMMISPRVAADRLRAGNGD